MIAKSNVILASLLYLFIQWILVLHRRCSKDDETKIIKTRDRPSWLWYDNYINIILRQIKNSILRFSKVVYLLVKYEI